MKISANGVDFARWVPAAFSQIAHDGTIPIIELFLDALFCIAISLLLDFSGGAEVDLSLAVVTGFFVMFFTLFLVTASMAVNDQRWQLPKASFRKFLEDCVSIDRGMMRGRDVLIHITMLPVTLAVAGTLIGLVWSIVRTGSS